MKRPFSLLMAACVAAASAWAADTPTGGTRSARPMEPADRSGLAATSLLYAQYKAPRQYMNRLSPAPPPAQPARPALPAATGALPAAPPADAQKVAAERAAANKRAVDFQRQRAEAGSASAQYELGRRYMIADGVETNLVEARKWLEAATKQGHEGATKRLEDLNKLEASLAPKPAKPAKPVPPVKPTS